jgi:hypothetical protein
MSSVGVNWQKGWKGGDMSNLVVGRYRFFCRLVEPALLPPYKGSTFRGAFGGALKKVVCAVREVDCGLCMLRPRCLYAKTFELGDGPAEENVRIAAPPHPYVIEPPLTDETKFAAGECFDFTLLLFGETNDYLPYFVYAFENMGETGIGKRLGEHRSRFVLTDVHENGASIYDCGNRKLQIAGGKTALTVEPYQGAVADGTLTVRLVTALRLKSDSRLQAELPFHLLVRSMLRRISTLFESHGSGEPMLDYKGLVFRAKEVETVASRLRWTDWERYSNRQEKTMLMGGIQGTVTYRGALSEYLPLLDLCRELHIGKQTSFGLGMIDYTWEPDQP